MLLRDESELIAYLAANPSGSRLVLRDAPDSARAVAALRAAAHAVWRIPHPVEPSDGLPNFCTADIDDGLPVLMLDVQDNSHYAGRIAEAILGALDADGIDGRLEPFPRPFTPPPAATTPYERPEPRTVDAVIGRIAFDLPASALGDVWIHELLPLRERQAAMRAQCELPPDVAPLPEFEPGERVEVDEAGVPRLTERGNRDIDEHMRRRAALLAPFLDGIEPGRLGEVRDACLRLAGVGPAERAAGREFFGSLEPGELLVLETFHALARARLGGMMPKRMWLDGRRLAMLRLHLLGSTDPADGATEAELADVVDDDELEDWLAGGERSGAVTRAAGVVRLTERGHQMAARYLEALGGTPEIYDVCWWIVRNFRRASP